ncbi:MAG TPA: 6,7-dimethyl-8-ribityllumazine synthase [Patescibacteria group bacterium]|nr:6,7-dimethyl-8-ribityllumazine synthase [Patescibacteria group bacterium]
MKKTKDIRLAIVSSSFRPEVTGPLEKHCLKALQDKGVGKSQVAMLRAPGALEIPLVVKLLAEENKYDAIIVFGAIYKGKTYHFEQIANETARACMDLSLKYELPIIYEILAVYDPKDAVERATRKVENKGAEAAHTALAMIQLVAKL